MHSSSGGDSIALWAARDQSREVNKTMHRSYEASTMLKDLQPGSSRPAFFHSSTVRMDSSLLPPDLYSFCSYTTTLSTSGSKREKIDSLYFVSSHLYCNWHLFFGTVKKIQYLQWETTIISCISVVWRIRQHPLVPLLQAPPKKLRRSSKRDKECLAVAKADYSGG